VGLTDTITFTCSACGHSVDFPRAQEGKAIYCPKCQAAQVIRAPGSTTDRFKPERIPTGRIVKADAQPTTDRVDKPHGMAGTARIDFTCGACNHLSRISAALSGQPVRCPTCGTVQLAGVAGLRVVRLDGNSKLPFTCTSCNYQARLNPEYSGKAIRCPKCQGAQVVPRILRDPSGTFQALPSGAAVVRSEPGTGSLRKTDSASFRKDAPIAPAVRSEPSPALRTPASGTPVVQPMPTPTPLPGSLAAPPSGSFRPVSSDAIRTPLPTSMDDAPKSSPALPLVSTDEDSQLDLGDSQAATTKPKGGVVRRSGRMVAQTTPSQIPAEPTLEPARAVRPDPEDEGMPQAPPERPMPKPAVTPVSPTVASAPEARPAVTRHTGPPAWLVPILGVAAVVGIIASIVLVVMLNSRSATLSTTEQQRDEQIRLHTTAQSEVEALKLKLVEREASNTLITADRDEQKVALEALRREQDTLKSELERVKAEAAALAKPPAKVSAPAVEPGKK